MVKEYQQYAVLDFLSSRKLRLSFLAAAGIALIKFIKYVEKVVRKIITTLCLRLIGCVTLATKLFINPTITIMRKIIFIAFIALLCTLEMNAQTFKVITSVESIVPNGFGRSRIINALEEKDYKEYTSVQTDDDNTRNKSEREDIRVKNFEETKLLNFYNIAGIRFQNIAANDALLTSMINDMTANGWELAFVTSAVESESGKGDGQGIFITRYIFKK